MAEKPKDEKLPRERSATQEISDRRQQKPEMTRPRPGNYADSSVSIGRNGYKTKG